MNPPIPSSCVQSCGNGMLEGLGLVQQNPVETEIEILRSRTNVEEVVRRLKLDVFPVVKK